MTLISGTWTPDRIKTLNNDYLHGSVPYWNSMVSHPDYDDFWKQRSLGSAIAQRASPEPQCRRVLGPGGSVGALADLPHSAERDPNHNNYMVAGPWLHGQWQSPKAENIGSYGYGGHDTAREFRRRYRGAFLPLFPSW